MIALRAHGQLLYGSLTGTVNDSSGALVSGDARTGSILPQ
jgi:hypothetical protein